MEISQLIIHERRPAFVMLRLLLTSNIAFKTRKKFVLS